MRVCRWGNGLTVQLSACEVDSLGLREGDDVVIEYAGSPRRGRLDAKSRREALRRLKGLQWVLPPDFVLRRGELIGGV